MTEYIALIRKAFPKAKDIIYGEATITLTGSSTSGSATVTFTHKWPTAPTVFLCSPQQTLSASSNTNYPSIPAYYDTLTTTGMKVYLHVDTSPGYLNTSTYVIGYFLVGEKADQ